jgi:hypothetical protein
VRPPGDQPRFVGVAKGAGFAAVVRNAEQLDTTSKPSLEEIAAAVENRQSPGLLQHAELGHLAAQDLTLSSVNYKFSSNF